MYNEAVGEDSFTKDFFPWLVSCPRGLWKSRIGRFTCFGSCPGISTGQGNVQLGSENMCLVSDVCSWLWHKATRNVAARG